MYKIKASGIGARNAALPGEKPAIVHLDKPSPLILVFPNNLRERNHSRLISAPGSKHNRNKAACLACLRVCASAHVLYQLETRGAIPPRAESNVFQLHPYTSAHTKQRENRGLIAIIISVTRSVLRAQSSPETFSRHPTFLRVNSKPRKVLGRWNH